MTKIKGCAALIAAAVLLLALTAVFRLLKKEEAHANTQ